MKKTEHHRITGVVHCISGIRIGGSDDLLQIGGTDLTCIKHPTTLKPYIPGSSMKGKMRSELEKKLGKFGGNGSEPCGCVQKDCLVCRVFGPHKQARHDLGPTRIIVRDAALLEGGETELKPENVIDRRTGTAMHPRKVERVVAGSKFTLDIGLQVWDIDHDDSLKHAGQQGAESLIEFVKDGLRELQNTGLGSGVSKGSGQVEFIDLKLDGTPLTL
jgi:CRISPR-associated protein Csm3